MILDFENPTWVRTGIAQCFHSRVKKEGAGSVGPGDFTSRPSRPGESHPKPLTDSGLEPVAGEITIRQPQVARESHNRSPWRSTSKSTKTSFAGFSPVITDRHRNSGGTFWLTLLGHTKDSLWSMDLFRCESATMGTDWVLVVMDQYTRTIIGFGVSMRERSMVRYFVGCLTRSFKASPAFQIFVMWTILAPSKIFSLQQELLIDRSW